MKHIQYGYKYQYKLNGINKSCVEDIWTGIDDIGKNKAMEQILYYTKLNEKFIAKNKPMRHEVSLISREVGNIYLEGDFSEYDNEDEFEERIHYFSINNEELDLDLILKNFVGHKIKLSIEYVD